AWRENPLMDLEKKYGRMCLKIHQVERKLLLLNAASLSDGDLDKMAVQYGKLEKSTLGSLVSTARREKLLDEDLLDLLSTLVAARNILVHRFIDVWADSLASSRSDVECIEKIGHVIVLAEGSHERLSEELCRVAPGLLKFINRYFGLDELST
ncbi:TPA: hypothetical protein I7752_21390, partial [Vibrio vulnificus]|nr:hypothetical protein [Vibrio vulnificus]